MLNIKIRKKTEKTEEEKARALAKKRERQRRKMIRTRYGHKKNVHAKKGIQSCILAAMGGLLLIFMMTRSFHAKGNIGILTGFVAIAILVAAYRGLRFAMRGFRERDKNYITCKVGVVCNAILLVCMCAIFIRGLF